MSALILSIGEKISEIKIDVPEFDYLRIEDKLKDIVTAIKGIKISGGGGGTVGGATELTLVEVKTAIQALGGAVNYATQVDKTSTTDVIYVGDAVISSLTSNAVWRIQKIDKTGGNVSIKWADGDELFNNIWDNRTSLTYS